MIKLKKRKLKKRRDLQAEKIQFQGSLGGEVTILPEDNESIVQDLGFPTLESAKEHLTKKSTEI